jgi:hypothetical protein
LHSPSFQFAPKPSSQHQLSGQQSPP